MNDDTIYYGTLSFFWCNHSFNSVYKMRWGLCYITFFLRNDEWNGSMRKSSLNELYKREKKMARKKQIDCLYVILMIHYCKIEAKKINKKKLVILPRLLADEEEVEELLVGSLVLVGRRRCSWRMLSISASIGSAFRCGGGPNTLSVTYARKKIIWNTS